MSIQSPDRRQALKCLSAWSGAAVVWTVSGGVPRALGATSPGTPAAGDSGALTFVQISDTHIGFRKEANPDVVGSLRHAIADINALPQAPAFVVHTGDVSHLSKPEEFGGAREILRELHVDRVHTVPGEHDAIDDGVTGYLKYFDHDGNGRGWYSFDQGGVHFVGLNNVMNFKLGTMAALGDEQLGWLKSDLAGQASSTPIVVLGHIPLWTIWEPWGWGTSDSAQALALLRPFGSVTVLNGHIHQVLQKVEGHISLHTAMSLAYPWASCSVPASFPWCEVEPSSPWSIGRSIAEQREASMKPALFRAIRASLLTLAWFAALSISASLAAAPTLATTPATTVDIAKFAFVPKELTVEPGTKVRWTNRDETPHTVTSQGKVFASKAMDTDDQFEFTFAAEGDFAYFCTVHPFMTGVVHVRRKK